MPARIKNKESDVQKTIIDWLFVNKVFAWRNNTGGYATEGGGFVRYGAKGSPDILACVKGRFVGIEVKAVGNKQNRNQEVFQRDLQDAGGLYIMAYDVDDVKAAFIREGLL